MSVDLETLTARVTDALGDAVVEQAESFGDLVLRVRADAWRSSAETLRRTLGFDYLSFISGIDWMPAPVVGLVEGLATMHGTTASVEHVVAKGDGAVVEHIVIGAISHDSDVPYFNRFERKAVVTRAEYFTNYNKSEAGQEAKREYYTRNKEAVVARAQARTAESKNAYKKKYKQALLFLERKTKDLW